MPAHTVYQYQQIRYNSWNSIFLKLNLHKQSWFQCNVIYILLKYVWNEAHPHEWIHLSSFIKLLFLMLCLFFFLKSWHSHPTCWELIRTVWRVNWPVASWTASGVARRRPFPSLWTRSRPPSLGTPCPKRFILDFSTTLLMWVILLDSTYSLLFVWTVVCVFVVYVWRGHLKLFAGHKQGDAERPWRIEHWGFRHLWLWNLSGGFLVSFPKWMFKAFLKVFHYILAFNLMLLSVFRKMDLSSFALTL